MKSSSKSAIYCHAIQSYMLNFKDFKKKENNLKDLPSQTKFMVWQRNIGQ